MTPNSLRVSFRRSILFYLFLLAFLLSTVAGLTAPAPRSADSSEAKNITPATLPIVAENPMAAVATEPATQARLRESYGKLPLSFEANQGQTDRRVNFVSRGNGFNLFFTPTEVVLRSQIARRGAPQGKKAAPANSSNKTGSPKSANLRMKFVGANPAPGVVGVNELPGKSNYFIGNDPAKWRTNVPSYSSVRYTEVYRGVDIVFYGNQQEFEYDIIVAPGSDPRVVRLAFDGAHRLSIDERGDLSIGMRTGRLVQRKPLTYQEVNGRRQIVVSRYILTARNEVGFQVGAYDASKPLVIDPSLVYSTYVGGASPSNGNDQAFGIAVDNLGNAYITGQTASTTFPVTPGAFRTTPDTGVSTSDAFVTKLNPTGTALVYSTYLGGISPFPGGSSPDTGYSIAVDTQGNAYVAGHTWGDFPVTPGAAQFSPPAATDKGFITKLNPTGTGLVYSSYIGGNAYNFAFAVAIDASGHAYVAGSTGASNFPVTPGAFQTTQVPAGNGDAFVVKLNPAGSAYDYATYLGGSLGEDGLGIAVDAGGRAYVTGLTSATDFPVTPNAFQMTYQSTNPFFGQGDAFLTVLDAAGASTPYSTYLGGTFEDRGHGVAVDPLGAAYIVGLTGSSNFPTTPGALQTSTNFNTDAFVTKLDPAASGVASLVYSTYLGGSLFDRADGVGLDAAGNVLVGGSTVSNNFPITSCAAQTTNNGGNGDAFLTKLNLSAPGPAALVYSTYHGGSGFDAARDVAVDVAGDAYIAGTTQSANFPTTPGAFQTALQISPQAQDAFVAKFNPAACVTPCQSDQDNDGVCDDVDNCTTTANADQADADNDGVGDACDGCANDPNKSDPGVCGCGVPDTDSDNDGTPDCNDQCPNDPGKTAPGACGCGVADTDTDGDGTPNCNDACPNDPNKIAPGICGCGVPDADGDGDGVLNCQDNCPTVFNPDQRDTNGDGVGDVCTSFQFPSGGGFVIGNQVSLANGATVYFWGSQWSQNNPMSGGSAPNAFKGFEDGALQPACDGIWTSQPGNSSNPPSTIPQYMAVIVSSSVQKNGPVISGDIQKIIIVQTNPGYGPSPGHVGTGQVVAILCGSSQSASLFYDLRNPDESVKFQGLKWLSDGGRENWSSGPLSNTAFRLSL